MGLYVLWFDVFYFSICKGGTGGALGVVYGSMDPQVPQGLPLSGAVSFISRNPIKFELIQLKTTVPLSPFSS
jgi:hypothetical protein